MNKTYLAFFGVAILALAMWYQNSRQTEQVAQDGSAIVMGIELPDLDGNSLIGSRVFAANCAACHGDNAGGLQGSGPPLVHKIYEPSHHGDGAFLLAVRNGVRSHHWRFGDMAPIQGLSDADVAMVVEYVRALQRENGIN